MGQHCPPCIRCAFPTKDEGGDAERVERTLVDARSYGCVRKDGGALVETESGRFGLIRATGFYPISEAGIAFHRSLPASPLAGLL